MEMASVTSGSLAHDRHREGWEPRPEMMERRERGGLPWGWMLAGVAVAGLGFLVWRTFGPDLRRYIKIERM
jgi:hypothetical protein